MNEKQNLVKGLQELYDDNSLSEKDEITVLDTIKYLGGSQNW